MRAKACSPGRVREPWDLRVLTRASPRSGRQKFRNRRLLVATAADYVG
jgi:hypothetical protein